MDASSLAVAVATAVGQGALNSVGTRAVDNALEMIRHRFRRDSEATATIDHAASDPTALATALVRYIESDPDFAADLRDWLNAADPGSAREISNQVSGTVHGSVIQGQNVNLKGRFSFRGSRGQGR
ncbi:hypothetical protein [Streptomyces sp. NPDC058695]|uniref:hypothetical protein n=1 Tax=Streptomyces sp. NPDC058695 TaxID=3346604 RepID=UPI003664F5F5